MRKLFRSSIAFALLIIFLMFQVSAHPGRTDSSGGHYNRSTGEYHYHHGHPPHQHTNGICPYNYDDMTGNNSGASIPSVSSKESITEKVEITSSDQMEGNDQSANWIDTLVIIAAAFLFIVAPTFSIIQYIIIPPIMIWLDNRKYRKSHKEKEASEPLTYYDILGVPFDATQEQIKKAYKEQIRFFHPDVFDGSEEVAKIKTLQLNEAYEILGNPQKRSIYDNDLKRQGKYKTAESRSSTTHESHKKEEASKQPEKENKSTADFVDEDRVKEERTKKEEKAKKFWRNAKIIIALVVAAFVLYCIKIDIDSKTDAKVQAALDEGYKQGYAVGYEEGTAAEHEAAYSAGFEEGCELAADVATYKTMLELTGVFFDPKMGLYHKEGCQLLPEDAEFDLEEIAVEKGLEPCHFCIMSADYSSGYQAGYAAGWVDRANEILSEG